MKALNVHQSKIDQMDEELMDLTEKQKELNCVSIRRDNKIRGLVKGCVLFIDD
jgi:hypothetical protein